MWKGKEQRREAPACVRVGQGRDFSWQECGPAGQPFPWPWARGPAPPGIAPADRPGRRPLLLCPAGLAPVPAGTWEYLAVESPWFFTCTGVSLPAEVVKMSDECPAPRHAGSTACCGCTPAYRKILVVALLFSWIVRGGFAFPLDSQVVLSWSPTLPTPFIDSEE